MPDGAAIGGLLCILVLVVAIGTLVGAVFLRAAVALYNKMAGGASSPSRVPEPAFGKAMWITFFTSLVQMVIGFLIDRVRGDGAAALHAPGQGVDIGADLTSFAVSLLVMVSMLSAMLPTSFGRAILVTLCYLLIVILVVGILVGIGIAVAFALRA